MALSRFFLLGRILTRRIASSFVLVAFLVTQGGFSSAQGVIVLPEAGTRLALSPVFAPPLLKGLKVYRNDPFRFDFLLDTGDSNAPNQQLMTDSNHLIKYFLAALTIPEKDLWVNLSPYEKDRIVPEAFGQTEMGRDLLAQDYILKQITASVIYPEDKIGKEFWDKVYAQALKQYGSTDIPVDTFNKVWIIPEKATVYEHKDSAFVVESKLKVMLEQDYLALEKNTAVKEPSAPATNRLGSDIVREVVIPILEKEINESKNFAPLRQVYFSLILATWYKRKVKASLLGQAYVDQHKTVGIDITDKNEKEKIWQQYAAAFKKGAYNLIKEEYDPSTQTTIARKYFSGGADMSLKVFKVLTDPASLPEQNRMFKTVHVKTLPFDHAQASAGRRMSFEARKLHAWAKEHRGQTVGMTQAALAEKYGLSIPSISRILDEYSIETTGQTGRETSEKVKDLRAWAQAHREQKVDVTQAELAEERGLSQSMVSRILAEYLIETKGPVGRGMSNAGKDLRAWAQAHRKQKIEMTQAELADEYGLSQSMVSRILEEYSIETTGQIGRGTSDEAKNLRAWAEKHRGQSIKVTQAELAKRYGLSTSSINWILKEYAIGTRGNTATNAVDHLRKWGKIHRGQTIEMTQAELAEDHGLSQSMVSRILNEYSIKTTGREGREMSDEGIKLRAWAEKHRRQRIKVTQAELGERYGLSKSSVNRILGEYSIATTGQKGRRTSDKAKDLRAWAEKHRHQSVKVTRVELAEKYDLSKSSIGRILGEYSIKTAGYKSTNAVSLLRAWAEEHQEQKIEMTLLELSAKYNISIWNVWRILDEYAIRTMSRTTTTDPARKNTNNGGIDLDPARIDLKTKNNGGEIAFNIDPELLERVQNASGLTPVILSIDSSVSVQEFVGLAKTESNQPVLQTLR